jgi:hypothetical protein
MVNEKAAIASTASCKGIHRYPRKVVVNEANVVDNRISIVPSHAPIFCSRTKRCQFGNDLSYI